MPLFQTSLLSFNRVEIRYVVFVEVVCFVVIRHRVELVIRKGGRLPGFPHETSHEFKEHQ